MNCVKGKYRGEYLHFWTHLENRCGTYEEARGKKILGNEEETLVRLLGFLVKCFW